jgi:DNA-binding response OmpR family regulator
MVSQTQARLLLVDNNARYRQALAQLLDVEGYGVTEAESVEQGKAKLQAGRFDLALLDLRLDNDENDLDLSGLDVARAAGAVGVPCIVVTAFPSVVTARLALRARGAEALADDFVCKGDGPQAVLDSVGGVLERVRARARSHEQQPEAPRRFLRIDTQKELVYLNDEPLDLSLQQYNLLKMLFAAQDHHLSAQQIVMAIWGEALTEQEAAMDKRLQNLVQRLRDKLHDPGPDFKRLVKVRSRGYRLIPTA